MDAATPSLALPQALEDFLSTADPSHYTFDLPDNVVAALIEAEAISDESTDTDEATGLVYTPVKPRPNLNFGAIALPEPD